jgi:hypothetical protein
MAHQEARAAFLDVAGSIAPDIDPDTAAAIHDALAERERFDRALVDRENFRKAKARAGGS